MPDYYKILGVSKTAKKKEIKKAYISKIKKYHPDLHPTKENEEITKMLNEAYSVLINKTEEKIRQSIFDEYQSEIDKMMNISPDSILKFPGIKPIDIIIPEIKETRESFILKSTRVIVTYYAKKYKLHITSMLFSKQNSTIYKSDLIELANKIADKINKQNFKPI